MPHTIKPLNSALPALYLDEVERRLETDPLTLGGLFDLTETGVEKPTWKSCFANDCCVCDGLDGGCLVKRSCIIYTAR